MCAQLDSLLMISAGSTSIDALVSALEDMSHRVTVLEAEHVHAEGLDAGSFDLVFLDMDSPMIDVGQSIERFKSGEGWPKPLVITIGAEAGDRARRSLALGADDYLKTPFDPALLEARTNSWVERKQLFELHRAYQDQMRGEKQRADDLLKVVIPLGVALSAEKDFNRLLEMILVQAKVLCNADAGTLYLRTEEDYLKFVIVRNDSLNLALGGTTGKPIDFPQLPLYLPGSGEPNHHNIATHTALTGATVNILDAYEARGFDFSGTRRFDAETGYRSVSFLTLPLKDNDDVIGVLQLINARDRDTGNLTHFDSRIHPIVESMALLATVALKAYMHEQSLQAQIELLQIEIDEVRKKRQVDEIVDSDYFQNLKRRARRLKDRAAASDALPDDDVQE